MNLNRDVFLALSTVIWASGDVTPAQAAALCEAARVSGLRGDDLRAIEGATQEPVSFDSFGPLELDYEERAFVYGLATWLARANGTLITSERDALARLGSALGLSLDQRMRAAIASRAIRDAREDDHGAVDVLALERELARQSAVSAIGL